MSEAQRKLRSAMRANPTTTEAPTAVEVAAQPRKGKKPSSKAKPPSKSQQQVSEGVVQPQDIDTEGAQAEKALRLAEIEDKMAKRSKQAKASHPRQRAPQEQELPPPESAGELGPRERETGLHPPRVPSIALENEGDLNRASGAKEPNLSSQVADTSQGGAARDKVIGRPEYEGIGGTGPDVEMYNPGAASHDTDTDLSEAPGSAVPPMKTPGKKVNKAVEKNKKGGGSSLRAQVQLNRQTTLPGSMFQKPLSSVDEESFSTPAVKKDAVPYSVQSWNQSLPSPPLKKQKLSNPRSVTSVTTSNEPSRLSKSSRSCTTIVESVAGLPPPPQRSQVQGALRGKKRQVEEFTFDSESPSDTSPPPPLRRKRNKPIESSSGAESDDQPPLPKRRQTAASSSKRYRKDKPRSHHTLPPPTQAKATQRATATTSHHKGHINHPDNNFDQSSDDNDDAKPYRAQDLPAPRRHKDAHIKRRRIEEQAPPPPKRKSRPVSRTHEEVDVSLSDDDEDIPSALYGGLRDEDDTAEENAAIASPVHPRVAARKNKASLKVKSEITAAPRNKNLPHGALEHNRWSGVFLPTFLKYVGMQEDIWTLQERETMVVLQIIWNRVYSGENPVGGTPVVHVVGPQVYSVVVQRVTEWRSSIGSTALAVVNDFLDSQKLYTTEKRKTVAADLLFYQRYIYYNTRDVEENGKTRVLRNGRYRGPLIIYTLAQYLIDTENAIDIPELIEAGTFPKAAIALSAVAVHRALELWEKDYITYESYYEAKMKNWKTGGIIKVARPDGKLTKTTNFGRKQYEQWSDQHCRDVWQVDDGKMQVIMADARKAVDVILLRSGASKRASHVEGEAGPSRKVISAESDPEFWSVTPAVCKLVAYVHFF